MLAQRALVFAVVCGVCTGQLATLYVAVSGSDTGINCSVAAKPCRTLAMALNVSNALPASASVKVQLAAGSYGHDSCQGLSLRDVTIAGVFRAVDIDCGGADRLLRVVNSSVDVRDLAVRNTLLNISESSCSDQKSEGGGAVSIEWGDDTPRSARFTNVSFSHSRVISARCHAYGGAVNAWFGSNVHIAFHNCEFFNTSAESEVASVNGTAHGGAVRLSARSAVNVDVALLGSTFSNTGVSSGFSCGGGAVSFVGGGAVSAVRFVVADLRFTNASSGARGFTVFHKCTCCSLHNVLNARLSRAVGLWIAS
jgi:hypothetical protein